MSKIDSAKLLKLSNKAKADSDKLVKSAEALKLAIAAAKK